MRVKNKDWGTLAVSQSAFFVLGTGRFRISPAGPSPCPETISGRVVKSDRSNPDSIKSPIMVVVSNNIAVFLCETGRERSPR